MAHAYPELTSPWPKRRALAALVLALAAALGRCSGAGIRAERLTATPVQTLSADHMTTVQFVRSWLAVQFPPPPPAPTPVADVRVDPVDADNDRIWDTGSYGQPLDCLSNCDSSGSGTWVVSGVTVRGTWGPHVSVSAKAVSQRQAYEYPGMTLEYTSTTIFPPGGGNVSYRRVGTQTLADGRVLRLDFANDGVGEERARLVRQEDGIELEFAVRPPRGSPGPSTFAPASPAAAGWSSPATCLGC